MERQVTRAPRTQAADPAHQRELFFLELAIAELTCTVPQSAPTAPQTTR